MNNITEEQLSELNAAIGWTEMNRRRNAVKKLLAQAKKEAIEGVLERIEKTYRKERAITTELYTLGEIHQIRAELEGE